MCKTPKILPGMPGNSAKPHKTHMKRTESQQAERWGEIIRNKESLGSTAASSRAHHHPTPASYSLVFANKPEKILSPFFKGYTNTNTSAERLGLEKGRVCD